MKIGFDIDGVILNTERDIKFYADFWSFFTLNKPKLKNNEVEPEKCYTWTQEETDYFYNKNFDAITRKTSIIAGAKEIIQLLKKQGHEIYIISYRGDYRKTEISDAIKILKKFKVKFDGYYWSVANKMEKCKELGIDVYVVDNPGKVEQFANSPIKVLYFKDAPIREIKQKNVTTVYNWMDIYKEINKIDK